MRGGFAVDERGAHELTLLGQAGQALAEAQSFDQIKEIRDKAEAVRQYAQSASLGLDIQNRAAEVKLRAERQAGKLLSQMTLRGGDRRSKNHAERLKLDDLGISRNQSTRWQIQSKVPEDIFREHVKLTCDAGKELTSARLMRLAKQWSKSRRGNGRERGLNGNVGMAAGYDDGFPNKSKRSESNTVAEIVSELTNHHQLLDNVLRPVYSGEAIVLAAADRRIMRYLLLEIQQLLSRLDKWQQRASDCTHSNRQSRI